MDDDELLPTHFAPAERASPELIQRLVQMLDGQPVARAMMEAFAGFVFVLDRHRQVVAANTEALAAFKDLPGGDLLGLRPGELMGCVHAHDTPGGCGTGPQCSQCGNALAIVASQSEGVAVTRECLITLVRQTGLESGEFRVRATPLELHGEPFTVLVLQDISAVKRREVLESLLLGQVRGLVEDIRGTAQDLQDGLVPPEDLALGLMACASQLSEEMLAQRMLLGAERGDLVVSRRPVSVRLLFNELRAAFEGNPLVEGRTLVTELHQDATLHTDPVLLAQVLLPMVRNALEASRPGDVVKVWMAFREGRPSLLVSNPILMARQVAGRIFQRSFSTKAATGRGLGTYTMKLLGEKYLGGKVGFTCKVGEGTVFSIELPDSVLLPEEESLRPLEPPKSPPPAENVPAFSLPEPRQEGVGGRLLVVDDSRTVLSVLSKVLGVEHQVVTVSNGEDALRAAREWLPDLIFLDVVMPGMDGYEVCGRLKADPALAPIPVIFLSSLSQEQDEAVGLALGAIDYLAKPISPAIVTMRVRNHMALKRYRDMLEARSYEDGLTGIANRRRFDEVITREWSRAQRQQEPLSLILGDVDHFKKYNDGYGHQEGDACLQAVARALAGSLQRGTDLAARYGGEEFALVLPGTEAAGALQVAQRALESVRGLGRPHAYSSVADHVTVSLGVATVIPEAESAFEGLVRAADQALYRAKEAGRDRVVSA